MAKMTEKHKIDVKYLTSQRNSEILNLLQPGAIYTDNNKNVTNGIPK